MAQAPQTLTFRCPRALEGRLPPPIPATQGLPAWLKTMPSEAYSSVVAALDDTVKRCPPFVDALTTGFLIPLMCDVHVERGEFSWDFEAPAAGGGWPRSPIGFHDAAQAAGTPLFDDDRFLIKFHNAWTIETPSIRGIMRSTIMTSNSPAWAAERPASPSLARTHSWPASVRPRSMTSAASRSSSTIRIRIGSGPQD